jgi:O-Antigen ligase
VLRSHAPRAAEVILGGALAGVAFGAAGGSELTRTTIVEVAAVLVGGLVVAAAVLWGRPGPVHGGVAVALFAALAALTALSVMWAVVPALAYVETGRTLAYLAIFAGAVAGARLAPRATPVVVTGVVLAATAAVVYALAARVWPASIGETEISNRIGQPFQYWNAVGTTAALAIPGLLWLATRRGAAVGRVLAYPGLGAAILAMLLTQSRGALAAAAIGTVAWLAFVPLRLRTLPAIVLPAIGAGAVAAWALSKDAFSVAAEPLSVKESVAGDFGLLLVLMALGLVVAGALMNAGLTRDLPSPHVRRRIGIVALAIACVIPLVAFTSVAFSDKGIGGAIGDRFDQLTSETETAPTEQGAGRLTAASSTRGKYWREADKVFDDRPAIGLGAGNFATARLRHRTDNSATRHAHGYIPQTMADLGIVGVAISVALLLAWLVAVARATGLHPRRLPFRRGDGAVAPRRDWDADRVGLVALALIAVVFGLQSAIDWTWFVPGPTAMALVAGGFAAGRAPLGAPEVVLESPLGAQRLRLLAASGVLLATVVTAWAIWQPEASSRATNEAVRLADGGDFDAAIGRSEDAADANPLTSEPLLTQAAIETEAGDEDAAEKSLEQAVLKFPGDPYTWYRLAAFQLGTLDQPAKAAATIQGAIFLDPRSMPNRILFLQARARERERAVAAAAR